MRNIDDVFDDLTVCRDILVNQHLPKYLELVANAGGELLPYVRQLRALAREARARIEEDACQLVEDAGKPPAGDEVTEHQKLRGYIERLDKAVDMLNNTVSFLQSDGIEVNSATQTAGEEVNAVVRPDKGSA